MGGHPPATAAAAAAILRATFASGGSPQSALAVHGAGACCGRGDVPTTLAEPTCTASGRCWIMAKVSSAAAVRCVICLLACLSCLSRKAAVPLLSPPGWPVRPPRLPPAPTRPRPPLPPAPPPSSLGAGSPAALICCNHPQFRIHKMRTRKPRANCNGRCTRKAETLPHSEPPPIAIRTAFLTTVPVALGGGLAVLEVAGAAGTYTQ